jgi:hypothetical protein
VKGTKSDPTYKKIDRKHESGLVLEWQKTEDEAIFLSIFEPRKETLKFLAQKYHYVCEDMESEMRTVFMKAMRKYGRAKGAKSFNTYLYTSCLNHIRNMIKAKTRGKRTDMDGTDPEPYFVRLDMSCDDSEDRGSSTYHDVIEGKECCFDKVEIRDYMRIVQSRSWVLLDIMMDTAASGVRRMGSLQYRRSIPHVDNAVAEEEIANDVNLPAKCYETRSWRVRDGILEYNIEVSARNACNVLKKILAELREG